MKLLFLIASLECGGAERVAAILCNHWARRGWRVTLATFDDGSRPPFFSLDPAVRHLPLALQRRSPSVGHAVANNLRRVPRLRRLLRDEAPERVLSFIDGTNVLALLASRGLGIPVVVSERVHPAHHAIPRPWRILRRLTYPLAHAVVVQTRDAAAFFSGRIGRASIAVIPNPVESPPASSRDPRGPRSTIAALGRLDPQKGFDLLIDAFALASPGLPDWDVVIHGEGPERAALERRIVDRGLSGRVHLPGRTADVAGAFARADLFVLSSRYEGFPNALAEAMASGVPSVAFDCPSGPADLVRDGIDGVLLPREDVGALAGAIARLASDSRAREALGLRAREVVERFSVPRVAGMWESVLRDGAGEGRVA